MVTKAGQISLVFSGGSTNLNPNNSLGGDPSSTPVTTNIINNIFDDVSPEQSKDGHEDYRCVYLFNDGDTTIYSVKIWTPNIPSEGVSIQLGTSYRDETQRITISGGVASGGNLTLSYLGTPFTTNYNSDLGAWSNQIQNLLNNLLDGNGKNYFNDVVVIAQTAGSGTIIFDVKFSGLDGKRSHDKFAVVSNNLTPSLNVLVSIPQIGAPINTIAPEINNETTPPGGVVFSDTSVAPIQFPRLDPSDGIPIWFKRTVSSGADPVENDQFTMSFSAQSQR